MGRNLHGQWRSKGTSSCTSRALGRSIGRGPRRVRVANVVGLFLKARLLVRAGKRISPRSLASLTTGEPRCVSQRGRKVIRGRAIGVAWDLLGTTKQEAQERHKRATERRTAVDEIGTATRLFRQRLLTGSRKILADLENRRPLGVPVSDATVSHVPVTKTPPGGRKCDSGM